MEHMLQKIIKQSHQTSEKNHGKAQVFLGFPWVFPMENAMAFAHSTVVFEVMIVLDGVSAVGSSARVLRAFRMIRAAEGSEWVSP